jgi:hypothetical protein
LIHRTDGHERFTFTSVDELMFSFEWEFGEAAKRLNSLSAASAERQARGSTEAEGLALVRPREGKVAIIGQPGCGQARHPRRLRCVVYTRKSSEEGLEQEFNSRHAHNVAILVSEA